MLQPVEPLIVPSLPKAMVGCASGHGVLAADGAHGPGRALDVVGPRRRSAAGGQDQGQRGDQQPDGSSHRVSSGSGRSRIRGVRRGRQAGLRTMSQMRTSRPPPPTAGRISGRRESSALASASPSAGAAPVLAVHEVAQRVVVAAGDGVHRDDDGDEDDDRPRDPGRAPQVRRRRRADAADREQDQADVHEPARLRRQLELGADLRRVAQAADPERAEDRHAMAHREDDQSDQVGEHEPLIHDVPPLQAAFVGPNRS